jgi:cold shock CspA family protein
MYSSRSESSSPFLPRSASQSPKADLAGIIEQYDAKRQSGFIKLLDYGPHHPVRFKARNIILQFSPTISVGSKVALDIVPIPETPYKYEGRKIIFEDDSANYSKPDRKVGFIKQISHKKAYAFIEDKELGDAFFHMNDFEPKGIFPQLQAGDEVSYTPTVGQNKKAAAKNVRPINLDDFRQLGKIKRVFVDKGYGFVTADDGEDIFFHIAKLDSGTRLSRFRGGDRVSFTTTIGRGGKKEAMHVRPSKVFNPNRTHSRSRSPKRRHRRH